MRHKVRAKTFGRDGDHRKALIRNLVFSLVEHEKIKTTLPKAKELRRHAEKAVTLAKKGTVHARRVLASRYPNDNAVKKLVDDLAPLFKNREGGYTRITKVGRRVGDTAEMAVIEWVDKTSESSPSKEATGKKAKAKKKTASKKTES